MQRQDIKNIINSPSWEPVKNEIIDRMEKLRQIDSLENATSEEVKAHLLAYSLLKDTFDDLINFNNVGGTDTNQFANT